MKTIADRVSLLGNVHNTLTTNFDWDSPRMQVIMAHQKIRTSSERYGNVRVPTGNSIAGHEISLMKNCKWKKKGKFDNVPIVFDKRRLELHASKISFIFHRVCAFM